METLEQALRRVAQARWQGRRCYATNMSQAQVAITQVSAHTSSRLGLFRKMRCAEEVTVADVEGSDIQMATRQWYAAGLAPATINKRLNCLSALGVNVEGCRVREPKALKWWLKPEDADRVCEWLRAPLEERLRANRRDQLVLEDLIRWTTRTGVRIEESLRLTVGDLSFEARAGWSVTVPGLKTASAQATLPLATDAAQVAMKRKNAAPLSGLLFPISYEALHTAWAEVREAFGWSDNPTATLKALRRSAARHLHITKGMPLDMVRQYLRHEDIETTMGYLRLTGGYGTEEMRRWL